MANTDPESEPTLLQARAEYFERNGFDESGYSDRWVKLPFAGRHFYLPNLGARRVCIPRHDLHHTLTQYETDWVGEFEISAWELGSGCGRYWFAWMVNSQVVLLGLPFYWRRVLRAWSRGRRCSNLYDDRELGVLLDASVAEVCAELGVDAEVPTPTARDRISLLSYFAAAATVHLLALAVPVALFLFILW